MSRNAHLRSQRRRCLRLALGVSLAAAVFGRAQTNSDLPPLFPPPTNRAEVFIVQEDKVTEAFEPRPDRVRSMLERALTNLTRKITVREAWLSLVSTQDTVGIKVFSEPGPNSGTRAAVVAATIQGLIEAGLPPDHVIIWDKHISDLRLAGFVSLARRLGVRVDGSAEVGYDEKVYYETPLLGNLVWGDLEFGKQGEGVGRRSFVSKLVSQQMTKIINITPLMNHNEAGVSGNLYSLTLGSVDNVTRFETNPGRLAKAVPELYALPILGDRVVLNIVDALICQYEGEERGLLHYSTTLNQLRLSRDPVALDVLSIQELERQRQAAKAPAVKASLTLYSNAALLILGVDEPKRIQIISVP